MSHSITPHPTPRWLIRGARVIDPASGFDVVADVAIAEGRILAIGAGAQDFTPQHSLDAAGLVLCPGLLDLAVQLRPHSPQHSWEREWQAANAGGITGIAVEANTRLPLDEPVAVRSLLQNAQQSARLHLWPLAALTRQLAGETLSEMAALSRAGCLAVTQGERAIGDTRVLLRALQYAATFGLSVWLRPLDFWLSRGTAASGALAQRLGLAEVPPAAEIIALQTAIELARIAGCRLHIGRLSSAAALPLLAQAKAEGLPISADVAVAHLHLEESAIGFYESASLLLPSLRQETDRAALCAALREGVLDAIVSDHAAITLAEKALPFAEAPAGASGLETLLPLTLMMGEQNHLSLAQTLSWLTSRPARLLRHSLAMVPPGLGELKMGGAADCCLFDPQALWRVEPRAWISQGQSTPFAGQTLKGRVMLTLYSGRAVFARGAFEPLLGDTAGTV